MFGKGAHPNSTDPRHRRGAAAEDLALRHLQAAGLELLERNYRVRQGEIDLIMRERDTLVFVEVRFRADAAYGSALESVGPRKQARIGHAALHYLQRRPGAARQVARFDVVGITAAADGPRIEWVRNAFPLS